MPWCIHTCMYYARDARPRMYLPRVGTKVDSARGSTRQLMSVMKIEEQLQLSSSSWCRWSWPHSNIDQPIRAWIIQRRHFWTAALAHFQPLWSLRMPYSIATTRNEPGPRMKISMSWTGMCWSQAVAPPWWFAAANRLDLLYFVIHTAWVARRCCSEVQDHHRAALLLALPGSMLCSKEERARGFIALSFVGAQLGLGGFVSCRISGSYLLTWSRCQSVITDKPLGGFANSDR